MSAADQGAGRDEVLAALTTQVQWCRALAAPFTASVVEAVHANLAAGGALTDVLVPWQGRPLRDALPIRIAGAFHALARAGRIPALAAYYPGPQRQPWNASAFAAALEAATIAERGAIAAFVAHPPQTNEVGRSAILMPGYTEIARVTGLPLRVLELGASAGLNLCWDRYAYALEARVVGPPDAALMLTPEWRGAVPHVDRLPEVADRRGCDRSPIDLTEPGSVDRLLAYVWPDHPERMQRLETAIAIAKNVRPPIDEADAGAWLEQHLAHPTPGVATVIAHTIVWQYFSPETSKRARAAIEQAAAQATDDYPIAWLAFEQRSTDAPPDMTLTLWPGGERRTVARAHAHGAWIDWLA